MSEREGGEVSAVHRGEGREGELAGGHWRIGRVVGAGGMGVVHEATHELLGRRAAVKVLRAELALDAEVCERFLVEARAAASIAHPDVVAILDFGRFEDGAPFFVMEWLEGESLGAMLAREGRLAEPRVARLGERIARALDAAHARGVIHRDMKPDNVVVVASEGDGAPGVKLVDFGVAKVASAAARTRTGALLGTPHYMAPEQAVGGVIDARADVYALGATLFELASGRTPFDGETAMAIVAQHVHRPAPALRSIARDASPALEAIVGKALAKRPEDRHASMRELADELARLARGAAPPRSRRRARLVAGLVAIVALVVAWAARRVPAPARDASLASSARAAALATPSEPAPAVAARSEPTLAVAAPSGSPASADAPSLASTPGEAPPAPSSAPRVPVLRRPTAPPASARVVPAPTTAAPAELVDPWSR